MITTNRYVLLSSNLIITHEFNGYNIKQLREYLTARKVKFTESEDRNALITKVFEYRQSIGWVELGEDGEP